MEKFNKGAVLITGTTSGVGLNTLKPLIEYGWDIIAVNRSSKRAIDEANKILKNNEIESINFIEIDLSDLNSVRDGAKEIATRFGNVLKVLICNAAIYKPRLKRPERSSQGFENSMAVNHFGHFLLINLLLESIQNSDEKIILNEEIFKFIPRITILGTVTANNLELGGKIPIPAQANLGDLSGFEKGFLSPISMANGKRFKPGKAYKDSKLCNMITAQELSKRFSSKKVISNSQEAKARDARLIGVSTLGPESEMFDDLFSIPKVSEWVSPLLTVVPLQLFSYHISAHKGLDVDQPRNLAKSVTVE